MKAPSALAAFYTALCVVNTSMVIHTLIAGTSVLTAYGTGLAVFCGLLAWSHWNEG